MSMKNTAISIILNVYKRTYTLEKQIDAIKNQSIQVPSTNIHVWYNKSNVPQPMPQDKEIKIYKCNWNTRFWGRFTVPLLLDTEYIAIFDDDIIPQRHWLKNCLDTIEKKDTNGILGGSGVILKSNKYLPHSKVGWNGIHSKNTIQVDLVGHAWFFRQKWCKYIWSERPYTWENGEDIMFSYLAQKYGNINTFVPPHPESNTDLWSNDFKMGRTIGNDKYASWRKQNHLDLRNKICEYCVNNGWKLINHNKNV